MATAIIEAPKDKRSFIVEQLNEDYITVRKTKNNTEYEVEVMVFTQNDLDEFKKIQEEIYQNKENDKPSLMARLIKILKS